VLRIGTLILVGPPLEFLPYHQSDSFPRSTQKPGPSSRRLHAGRRLGGKQVSPRLIPEQRFDPGFDIIPTLSTRHQRFTHVRLHEPYLIPSCETFSSTLTTMALYHSSLRWFEARSCKPAPRGLPSSSVQLHTSQSYIHRVCPWHTVVGVTYKLVAGVGQLPVHAVEDNVT
jgi:hypothetical protein